MMAHRRIQPGDRYTRLKVLADIGHRSKKGGVKWICVCDCGSFHSATTSNLNYGQIRSCGCLRKELSSRRQKDKKQPAKICKHPDCQNTTEKGSHGFCGMHSQRLRRYQDVDYVTPDDVWRKNNREAQLRRVKSVKPTTYRKYFGRHEHRVMAEKMIGRTLKSSEHVHHKDHNKQNNSIGNLQVLTAREHLILHAILRRTKKC